MDSTESRTPPILNTRQLSSALHPHPAPVRRKQYQSCDACRSRRRACDAVSRGVNPLQASDSSSLNFGCSLCEGTGRQCTFRWLQNLPTAALPLELKRKRQSFVSSECRAENMTSTHSRTQATSSHIDPNVLDESSWMGSSIYAMYDHLHHQKNAWGLMGMSHLTQDLTSNYFVPEACSRAIPVQDETFYHDLSSTLNSNGAQLGSQDLSSSHNSTHINMLDVTPDTTHSSALHSLESSITDEDTAAAQLELPTHDPLLEQFSGQCRPAGSALPSIPLELGLANTANQRLISSDLIQVYHGSLENALCCWLAEEHCPYRKVNQSWPIDLLQGSSVPFTYLQRIYELDRISQSLRPEKLSAADSIMVSKALKLVIMSFASQWTHDAASRCQKPMSDTFECGMEDPLDSGGFESLLQQSLWHEAQRYVKACVRINCFRSTFAQIVFSLVQPPAVPTYEDAELKCTAPAMLMAKARHSTFRPKSDGAAISDASIHSPALRRVSPMVEERLGYLNQALQNLLKWREMLHPWFTGRNVNRHGIQHAQYMASRRAALQMQAAFNVLFWFGLMCDTTSSALYNRPLVISDCESYALSDIFPGLVQGGHAAQPPNLSNETFGLSCGFSTDDSHSIQRDRGPIPTQINIWDLALMRRHHGVPSLAGAEAVLQEAIPTKVLLWRKLGTLKSLTSRGAVGPDSFEQNITAALEVADFWKVKYGPFVDECIRTHHRLSFKLQSWYVILAVHFHLACLFVADCIEHIDNSCWSRLEQRSFRQNSSSVLEMTKSSAYTITNIGQVCASLFNARYTGKMAFVSDPSFHYAIEDTALLSEPWTDVLTEAFSKTFETLFTWSALRNLGLNSLFEDRQLEWLLANTDSQDLNVKCTACADALEILGHKSDHSLRVARSMRDQLTAQLDLLANV